MDQQQLESKWNEDRGRFGVIVYKKTGDDDFDIAVRESYTIGHCTRPVPRDDNTHEIDFRDEADGFARDDIFRVLCWHVQKSRRVHNLRLQVYPAVDKRDVYQLVEIYTGNIITVGEYYAAKQ